MNSISGKFVALSAYDDPDNKAGQIANELLICPGASVVVKTEVFCIEPSVLLIKLKLCVFIVTPPEFLMSIVVGLVPG